MGAMAQPTNGQRRIGAYTLIEMMIVMVILIVVMALVAPVIGNARNAAKKTNTMQLLSNLSQASQQFELSERRTPGYFNPLDMASADNRTRGFTETANILLDLAGGMVSAAGPDVIEVGPTATATAFVKVGLIGSPTQVKGVVNKGYFTPDPKYFTSQSVEGKIASVPEHRTLPDLLDGFGQPVLAWRQDVEPSQASSFAEIDASASRASFYRAPNEAFIKATKLGRRGQNQTVVTNGENGSLLNFADDKAKTTMEAFLGNPAFPITGSSPSEPDRPAAARGRLIFHSAGVDGVYLGTRDRGGIIVSPGADEVQYKGGKDPLDNFDDVISVAGN
jgi:type II secretory pathway pseudopilin PulG